MLRCPVSGLPRQLLRGVAPRVVKGDALTGFGSPTSPWRCALGLRGPPKKVLRTSQPLTVLPPPSPGAGLHEQPITTKGQRDERQQKPRRKRQPITCERKPSYPAHKTAGTTTTARLTSLHWTMQEKPTIKTFAKRYWVGRESEFGAALARLQQLRPRLAPILAMEAKEFSPRAAPSLDPELRQPTGRW